MNNIVSIAKIIEGALEGDNLKVKNYAELIASNLEKEGEHRAAKIIRSRLDGTYKNDSKVTLD